MFELLDKEAIVRCLYSGWESPNSVAKPGKVLFNNTDILAAFSTMNEIGAERETFVASMIAPRHKLTGLPAGDLLVDEETGQKSLVNFKIKKQRQQPFGDLNKNN